MLDVGTGTGVLAIAAAKALRVNVLASDIDPLSVRVARDNARLNRSGNCVTTIEATGFSAPQFANRGRFDLVLSNPPYIASAELAALMPDVAEHEPASALDGGRCGLAAYRAIIQTLPRLLTPAGAAVLELGIGQSDAVRAIAEAAGFQVETRPDLSGTVRAIILHPLP